MKSVAFSGTATYMAIAAIAIPADATITTLSAPVRRPIRTVKANTKAPIRNVVRDTVRSAARPMRRIETIRSQPGLNDIASTAHPTIRQEYTMGFPTVPSERRASCHALSRRSSMLRFDITKR